MPVCFALAVDDDLVIILKYLIDHMPSIVTAIFAGLIMLRQSKGITEIKKTVGKAAATVRKDAEKVVIVTQQQHAEIKDALDSNTELTKSTESKVSKQVEKAEAIDRHVKNNEANTLALRKALEEHGIKCPPHIESDK